MADHGPCFVRMAIPDDINSLIDLCAEHAAYERAPYDPRGKGERLMRALFAAEPRLHAWVAEQGGRLVGYATASREFSTWDAAPFLHMDCLYLREAVRGAGAGKLLVREIARLARALGCANVQWQTPDWNERAHSFYRRLGAEGKPKVRFCLAGAALAAFDEEG
ncbi:MAG TPA: GNAT family N-acetyltransferase [Herpetosiphonaceae bacterium]|nr:GNAT family N-acetyltransferase [Herpetosiphonaceae bacterium]